MKNTFSHLAALRSWCQINAHILTLLAPPSNGSICCVPENDPSLVSNLANSFLQGKGTLRTAQNLCMRWAQYQSTGTN